MKIIKNIFCLLSLLFQVIGAPALFGQHDIPIGTWRTHLSYKNLEHLQIIDNKIFAAGNYSFLYFDKEDNSVNTLSKIQGFSNVDVTAIGYNEEVGIMILGYEGGGIDLVKDNVIVKNSEISNASIIGSKRINHINIRGTTAFIAADFGLIIFDLEKLRIKEIYKNLGPDGASFSALSSVIFSDRLVLATNFGIISGILDENINLMDHLNWQRFSAADGLEDGPVKNLAVLNNLLYAGIDEKGLFIWDLNSWRKASILVETPFTGLSSSNDRLLVSLDSELYVSSGEDLFNKVNDPLIEKPRQAAFDKEGKLWIADLLNGLISDLEGSFRSYSPEGLYKNDINKLYAYQNKVVGLSGGYNANLEPLQKEGAFSIYEKGTWANYRTSLNNLPYVQDLVDVKYDPAGKKLYFASFGSGILEWDEHDQFFLWNEGSGSSLQSTGATSSTFVTAIDIGTENTLWATNYGVSSPLHHFIPPDSWKSFSFNEPYSQQPTGVTVSANGDKWMKLNSQTGASILIFNENSNAHRLLTKENNAGNLPGEQVLDIVEDHEGVMWIATNKGIVYILNAYTVLNNEPVNAFIPRYEGGYLLRGESITAIKVDGGNRKWFGSNKGIWLFDAQGENLVQHFHTGNSPLPSNIIHDIEIDERSGEVFIATGKGLISFRGTATRATIEHQKVKIFPNPVRDGFSGQVGISGLAYNAVVKITDIKGQLVRQVYAEGGTAVWDVNDNRGRRAAPGVYLVLSASEDGEETFIGKIAVVE